MAKLKQPLVSLGASGSIGDAITFQRAHGTDFVRKKPQPAYRRTLAQVYHRWDYQDGCLRWHLLSDATKATWRSLGSTKHMSGFATFMSDYLSNFPNLIGSWRLDEHTGAVARDISPNQNHGTVIGALPVVGVIDHARWFDGVNDYINVPYHPSLNPVGNQMTLACIWTPETMDGGLLVRVITGRANQDPYSFEIRRTLTNFRFSANVQGVFKYSPNVTLTAGVTYRLVGVYDGANVLSYVNTVKYTGDAATGNMVRTTRAFTIGDMSPVNRPVKGLIDQVIIEDRAWTQAEVDNYQERRYP